MARYDGKKFKVAPLPPFVDVDAKCCDIGRILKQHVSEVEEIEWNGSPGTGLKLLENVECQSPRDRTYADLDVLGPEGQRRLPLHILAERVLLIGTYVLCKIGIFSWRQFSTYWHEDFPPLRVGHIRIAADDNGNTIEGVALFQCAEECEELKEILDSAYESLVGANIKLVIINSRKALSKCPYTLRANQILIIVDMHGNGCRIFNSGGLVHSTGGSANSDPSHQSETD